MKKYRLFFILCALCVASLNVMAQQKQFKNERRIYLWDVTLSMKGYQNKTPDIYDKVITALEKDINSILDDQTEIWLLPFQTKILDKWNAKATLEGKKELIEQIKKFKNEEVTNTNITIPMTEVMETLIDENKRNVLILLTDGNQNANGYPLETLLDVVRKWCMFAESHDAYAFYVMLTQFATNEKLIEAIDGTCRMHKILPKDNGDIEINFVELLPQDNYKYNIKDDAGKKLIINIDCKKRVEIPDKLKIRCYSEENSFVEVDQLVAIKNGQMELDLQLKQSYDELKRVLPQEINEKITLHFEVENKAHYPLVSLLNEECCLELINKPEKILKVYVKD